MNKKLLHFSSISILTVLWLVSLGVGFQQMLAYANTAGEASEAPILLPATLAAFSLADNPSLFMVIHSRCSCSRASHEELNKMITKFSRPVSITVLIVDPMNDRGSVQNIGLEIPGVRYVFDTDGMLSDALGAKTSGASFLYDAKGKLLFSGGITASRGHQGDNAGKSAVIQLANSQIGILDTIRNKIFGCSVFNKSTAKGEII